MHDPVVVHLLEPCCHSSQEFTQLVEGKSGLGFRDAAEQVAMRQELQNHVDGVFGLEDGLALEEMRRVERSQHLYLVKQD